MCHLLLCKGKTPTEGTLILGLGGFDCILHLWLGVGGAEDLGGQKLNRFRTRNGCSLLLLCLPWSFILCVAQFLLVNQPGKATG